MSDRSRPPREEPVRTALAWHVRTWGMVSDAEQVEERLERADRSAVGGGFLEGEGCVAAADEEGLHPHRLGAEDIVPEVVPHHQKLGWIQPEDPGHPEEEGGIRLEGARVAGEEP